jgi:hypothetical protein
MPPTVTIEDILQDARGTTIHRLQPNSIEELKAYGKPNVRPLLDHWLMRLRAALRTEGTLMADNHVARVTAKVLEIWEHAVWKPLMAAERTMEYFLQPNAMFRYYDGERWQDAELLSFNSTFVTIAYGERTTTLSHSSPLILTLFELTFFESKDPARHAFAQLWLAGSGAHAQICETVLKALPLR